MKHSIDNKIAFETIYELCFMDAWTLLEKHNPINCTCSYCVQRKKDGNKIRLWLPENKSRNSWRVLCWTYKGNYYYLRSTLPTWRWFVYITKWYGGWRFNSMRIGKNSVRSLISFAKGSLLPNKFGLESIFWIKM